MRRWGSDELPRLRSWPLGQRSGRTSALPCPLPRPLLVVVRGDRSCNLWCRLASLLTPQTGFFQFAVALSMDFRRQSIELVGRRHVADG